MSKGYADYLCVLAREIDREFQRDADGVEAPLFRTDYEGWLKTQVSEGTQVNYKRWLRKADAHILESDRDFWSLLKKAWEASDLQRAQALCKEYEKQLLTEKEQAEKVGKEESGESGKEIGNWLCAFRKYMEFHEKQIEKAPADKKAFAAMIEASRQTADNLFLADTFILWGIANGLADSTLESYVRDIKSVNRKIFCTKGHDRLHEELPGYVKARNEEKINEMFAEMDKETTELINSYNEDEMSRKVLINARAALRKYKEYIKSIIIKE